ncbi:hypothetical protein ACHAWC_002521 [Mediolabrus comicus]
MNDSTGSNVALLAIDFQHDFMSPGGYGEALGNDPNKLRHIIEPTRKLFSFCRENNIPIVHTREIISTQKWDQIPVNHADTERALMREDGIEIIPELQPHKDERIIDKPGKGAFYATDLEQVLRNLSIDTLVICGVTTEICVHTTVREARDRLFKCIVMEDCTASYFPQFHAVGLEMIAAQGNLLGSISDSKTWMETFKMQSRSLFLDQPSTSHSLALKAI